MSTMTTPTAQSFTTRIIPSCDKHPGDTCIELKLPAQPEGEALNFLFMTVRNPGDHSHIGVVQDLLLQCKPYRAPAGFKVVDNKTVHFFYPGDHEDHPVAFEAQGKLVDRLQAHIDETCAAYRRDPRTNLVFKR